MSGSSFIESMAAMHRVIPFASVQCNSSLEFLSFFLYVDRNKKC